MKQVIDRVLEKAGGTLAVVSHSLEAPSRSSSESSSSISSSASSTAAGAAASPGAPGELIEAGAGAGGGGAAVAEARAAAAAAVAALEAMGAERTRHGWLLLPDAAGCGPIYLAVLHKLASCDLRRVKVNKYARS